VRHRVFRNEYKPNQLANTTIGALWDKILQSSTSFKTNITNMTTAKTFTDLPEGIHAMSIFLEGKTERFFIEKSLSEGYATYMLYNQKITNGAYFKIINDTISVAFYAKAINHEYKTFDFIKFKNIIITQLPQRPC